MTTQDWIFAAIFTFQVVTVIVMFFFWQAREQRKALEKEEEEAQKREREHECKCGGCCQSNEQTGEQTPSVRLSEVLEELPRKPIQNLPSYSDRAMGEQACVAKPLRFPRGTIFTFGDISDK